MGDVPSKPGEVLVLVKCGLNYGFCGLAQMIERNWDIPLELELVEEVPARPTTHHFKGAGVETDQDELRLGKQYDRILRLMKDGRFRTLSEISAITHDPEGSILRQLSYMDELGHKKTKQRRGPGRGLWEYRITLKPEQAKKEALAYIHAKEPKQYDIAI